MAEDTMEWLMEYGWAILIVIIVAAALYALLFTSTSDISKCMEECARNCEESAKFLR